MEPGDETEIKDAFEENARGKVHKYRERRPRRRCCISFRVYYAFYLSPAVLMTFHREEPLVPLDRLVNRPSVRGWLKKRRTPLSAAATEECNKRSVPGPFLFIYIIYLFIVKWSRYCGRVCPRESPRSYSLLDYYADRRPRWWWWWWRPFRTIWKEKSARAAWGGKSRQRFDWNLSERRVRLKKNEIKGRCNNAGSFDREVRSLCTSFQHSTIYH